MNSIQSPRTKPFLDFWTAFLFVLMLGGQFFLFQMQSQEKISPIFSFLVALFLINFSFTLWHEAAHRNFSRWPWVNETMGIIASFFSLGPAYFHRKQEHLIHHRWQGDPEKDPVFPRLQTSFWNFPTQLLRLAWNRKLAPNFTLLPLQTWQKIVDALLFVSTIALLYWGFARGHVAPIVCIWLLPRFIIFFWHAYAICFFPHHKSHGGFQYYRVHPHWLWNWLTLNQNFHGVHHYDSTLLWHKYPQYFAQLQKSQAAILQEFEIIS